MINIDEALRTAYYNLLNGAITYNGSVLPVADGFSTASSFTSNHIIIGEVSEAKANTLDTYITDARVNIDIVTYQVNGWSRTPAATIEGLILALLIPTIQTHGLTTGLQIPFIERESARYLDEESDNGNIIRKIITILNKVTF